MDHAQSVMSVLEAVSTPGLRTATAAAGPGSHERFAVENHYGRLMYLLFGSAIALHTADRLVIALRNRLALRRYGQAGMAPQTRLRVRRDTWAARWCERVHTTWKRMVGTPALFGGRRAEAWGWLSIPTRFQALWIFAYVAINVWFCSVDYTDIDPRFGLSRKIADRTGILCFYNIPLCWMLGMRNQITIWLTGWSFAQATLAHRWVARVAVMQALVHTIAYGYRIWSHGSLLIFLGERWFLCGIGAMTCFLLFIPLSILPLRQKAYEVFLMFHKLLSFVIFPLLFLHIEIFRGHPFHPYLYASIAVTVLDRVARSIRIARLSREAKTHPEDNTTGTITCSPSGLIRLEVTTGSRFVPQSGEYYYLYFPQQIRPKESHPFSLASYRRDDEGRTILHFLVAPQRGATLRLFHQIEKLLGHPIPVTSSVAPVDDQGPRTEGAPQGAKLKVLVEGPYGHSSDIRPYETLILVAGGSGITAVLPTLHEISQAGGRGKVQRVVLVWVVKSLAYAADVLGNELSSWPDWVEVRVHITTGGTEGDDLAAFLHRLAPRLVPHEEEVRDGAEVVWGDTGRSPVVHMVPNEQGESELSTLVGGSPEGEAYEDVPSSSTTATTRVGSLDDVSSGEDKALLLRKQSPIVHAPSSGADPGDVEAAAAVAVVDEVLLRRPHTHLVIRQGRADMAALVCEAIDMSEPHERVAVMSCGPGRMLDDLRRAIAGAYGYGAGQVPGWRLEYFEESFLW